jgi:hypothetical protein
LIVGVKWRAPSGSRFTKSQKATSPGVLVTAATRFAAGAAVDFRDSVKIEVKRLFI